MIEFGKAEMGECLAQLIEAGAELPLYIATIGLNGAMVYYRFSQERGGSLELSELARHGGNFDPPINMMVIDGRGETYQVRISTEGEKRILH
jgi:hypothetical protein